jgi:large subunit ribosomal protein L10
MKKHEAHVSEAKKKLVSDLVKLFDQYKVIGAVNVENLPAKQLMVMRAKLRGKAQILMTKRRIINIALDQSKKANIQELKKNLKGEPALLFSNENPFKLYSILKKSKSPAPIKGGQKTPKDIVVQAGGTGFAPGPIIGELGQFGIKAGIENGKVAIKQDKVVAKEGEVVNSKLAAILLRLNIMPMEIGLNLTAVYEDGAILKKDVLDIDEKQFEAQIRQAASDAFRLTIARAIPLKENIKQLIQKAHLDAYALADSQSILTNANLNNILAKAEAQATALKEKTQ